MTNTLHTEAVESDASSGLEDEPTTRVRLRDLASVDRLTQLQFVSGTALFAAMGATLSVAGTGGSVIVSAMGLSLGGVGLLYYRECSRALAGGVA